MITYVLALLKLIVPTVIGRFGVDGLVRGGDCRRRNRLPLPRRWEPLRSSWLHCSSRRNWPRSIAAEPETLVMARLLNSMSLPPSPLLL